MFKAIKRMLAGTEAPKKYDPSHKDLIRNKMYQEAEKLPMGCIADTERESALRGWGVAPWYYERLAIVYRKQKRIHEEIEVLELFARQVHAAGVKPAVLAERLQKAYAIRDKMKS